MTSTNGSLTICRTQPLDATEFQGDYPATFPAKASGPSPERAPPRKVVDRQPRLGRGFPVVLLPVGDPSPGRMGAH